MRVMLVGKDSICRIGVEHLLKTSGVDHVIFEDTASASEAVKCGSVDCSHIVWVSFTSSTEDIVGLINLRHAAPNIPLIAHFQYLPPSTERALTDAGISVFVDEPNAKDDFLAMMKSARGMER